MTAQSLTIHVVVVNYCTADLTIDCLASLEPEVRATPDMLRVTVVDNASPDGSASAVANAIRKNGWGDWADLSVSGINGGFASGNNLALRSLLRSARAPDLFWLLNPDTRVVAGATRILHDFMRAHPGAGIIGSKLIGGDGSPWPFAFRFPSVLSEIERGMRFGPLTRLLSNSVVLRAMSSEAARVDWLPGASMMVRREVFETVGLMDEGYFLYFEETDFCLAVQRAGWECWYVPDASVIHLAGQSTGLTGGRPTAGRVPRYWFESRRRYFTKNHGVAYALGADVAWAAAHLLWRARRWMNRGEADPPALFSDFLRVSFASTLRQKP